MSSGDKKGGPSKPFLGDTEIGSELDAWDEMFDNLHGGPESASVDAPPMEWPAPTQQARTPQPEPPAPGPSDRADELAPDFEMPDVELDAQMTLDGAVEQRGPRAAHSTLADWQAGPDETDFSTVGAEGKPAALGRMLGGSGELPQWSDDDHASPNELATPDPDADHAIPAGVWDGDDDIYTSASRPNVKAGADDRSLPDDAIAPPPRPSSPALSRPSSPALPRRTGPAIIRRQTPLSVPMVPRATPPRGLGAYDPSQDFGEATRIGDAGEIEAKAAESRRADARSKAPTAPPPMSFTPAAYDQPALDDDDDEYEIEIGAQVEETPVAPAPRRTVAHVVRRAETPRAVPVMPAPRRESDPVIEVTEGVPSEPAGEADFSDVAAAVDAESTFDDAYVQLEPGLGELDVPLGEQSSEVSVETSVDISVETSIEEPAGVETPVPQEEIDVGLPPAPTGDRPPALMDLYPRVKRPTSVPVMTAPSLARDLRAPAAPGDVPPEIEPIIDVEAIGAESRWPEQQPPLASAVLDEDAAAMLLIYEREIPTVDEEAEAAALRIEAGRLCERLGDPDRARAHYDAALLADPRATAALRGLRRLARTQGDLIEATRHLDAEIAVAGALERRPLAHYRVDLLMASGEYDLARVAVGELLDSAPSDVRALLAQLELAFLDGRADEFGKALEKLAHAVTDSQLRAAVQQARALLAAQHDDTAAAVRWLSAATESDPGSLGARFGAIREAVARRDGDAAGHAMVDLASSLSGSDPATAAALAMRAQ